MITSHACLITHLCGILLATSAVVEQALVLLCACLYLAQSRRHGRLAGSSCHEDSMGEHRKSWETPGLSNGLLTDTQMAPCPLPLPSCDWHYLANYIASVVLSNQLVFPPSKKAPIKFLSEWQLSIWILGFFAKSVDSCWLLGLFGQPVSPSFYRLQLPDLFEWDRQLMEIGCTTFVMLDVSAFLALQSCELCNANFAMLTTLN